MKKYIALSLLALVLAVSFTSVGCSPTSLLSDEQAAEYQRLLDEVEERDSAINDQIKVIAKLEDQVGEMLVEASQGGIDANELATLNLASEALSAAAHQAETLRERQSGPIARLEELETAAHNKVGGVMGMLGAIYPPIGQVSNLWLSLGLLFFKRPTENLAKSVKKSGEALVMMAKRDPSAAFKKLASAGRSAIAAVGLEHTTHDPNKLIEAATHVAKKSGVNLTASVSPDGTVVFHEGPVA
jgi:TolA-binding protein